MKSRLFLAAAACSLCSFAKTVTWTGGADGSQTDWATASNWNPEGVPTGDDDIVINGGDVIYTAGADLYVNANGSLTINGGTFEQVGGIAWMQISGKIKIAGGTFNMGTCQQMNLSGTLEMTSGEFIAGSSTVNRAGDGVVSLTGGKASFSVNNWTWIPDGWTLEADELDLESTGDFNVPENAEVENLKLVKTAGDFATWPNCTFKDCDLSVGIIVPKDGTDGAKGSIVLDGTKLIASTDRGDAWCGMYIAAENRYEGMVDFKSGADSSYAFISTTMTDAASVYSALFATGNFTLDGKAVSSADDAWNHFEVSSENGLTTVAYVDVLSDNRIGSVSASEITSSSAVLSATVPAQDADTTVRFAFGTAAPTDAELLAGEAVAVSDGVATKALTDLVDLETYRYAFAIVAADGETILASMSGSFVASDYDYIWSEGAWIGGRTPTLNGTSQDKVLFADDYTLNDELLINDKMVKRAVLTTGTMLYGTLQIVNGAAVNTRKNLMNQAPYGFYGDGAIPLNFVSQSGNGTIHRAASYTFCCTDGQFDAFYANTFGAGKLKKDGENVSEEDFAAQFTLTAAEDTETGSFDYGEGEVATDMKVATVTLWDELPAGSTGNWTVAEGARVRVAGRSRLAALEVESATDAVIDLQGNRLSVTSLRVGGERLRGTYTAATLGILSGEGTLEVSSGTGFAITVR